MLVYAMFEGDDMRLARAQHDVYGQALRLIIDGSRRHFLNACVIGGGDRSRWPEDLPIDHRTLQDAHDIAAGAWRWRTRPPQNPLPLEQSRSAVPDVSSWLDWLRHEVASWWNEPSLVLAVVAIVTRQSTAIGYAGELRAQRALIRRYPEVPWTESLIKRADQ